MTPKKFRISEITKGPIRHESLPQELLDQIKFVYDTIGRYCGGNDTLEQWEISFMRDTNPEIEVAVWMSITLGWQKYHRKYVRDRVLTDRQERNLVTSLIQLSSGGARALKDLKVPERVGRRLLECYLTCDRASERG